MKRVRILVIALLLAFALLLGTRCYLRNRGFTPWMSLAEFNAFMKTRDSKKPGEPNYWAQGHWITAVAGRWHDGIPQYRIRYGDAPKEPFVWNWYINLDAKSFDQKLHTYADSGYTMVYYNKMRWPDGTILYQAVWNKPTASQ